MQLRRTAATAAIAALGGLAVLGTAPAATAATPSAQLCKTGLVGVSISGLGGSVLKQGGAAATGTVTLVNNTGHDLPEFIAALALGPDSSPNKPLGGITVSEKSGGTWQTLSYAKGLPGYIFLTGIKAPVNLPAGGKLSYTLRFQAPASAKTGPYHALAIGEDLKSVIGGAAAVTPEVAQSLQNQAAAAVSGDTANSATTNCTKNWGFAAAPFTVAAGGSSTPTSAPSASSKPSTEPVSSVSTSPAAAASPTGAVLAKTGGGNATLPVALGGALVVLGAGAVVMTRRRKAARH